MESAMLDISTFYKPWNFFPVWPIHFHVSARRAVLAGADE